MHDDTVSVPDDTAAAAAVTTPRAATARRTASRAATAVLRSLRRQVVVVHPSRRALVRLVWRRSPGLALGCAALILLSAAMPISVILIVERAMERVPQAVGHGLDSPAGHDLLWALIALAVIYVGQYLVEAGREAVVPLVADRMNDHVRQRLMRLVQRPTGIAHFEDDGIVALIATARGTVTGFTAGAASGGLVKMWSAAAAGIGAGLLLAVFSWWLPILVIVVCALAARWNRARYLRSVQMLTERSQVLRRATYLGDLLMLPGAAKEVRVFGLLNWIGARLSTEWRAAVGPVWRARNKDTVAAVGTNLMQLAVNLVALLLITRSLLGGTLGFGEVIILLQALLAVNALGTVSPDLLSVEYGTACLSALTELEDRLESDLGEPAEIRDAAVDALIPATAIRFEDVGFRYPNSDRPVFDGLNLEIPAGRSTAVVGVNGAGKTTLVKLLTRLYEPTAGRITVDGADLGTSSPERWRRGVSAIFQDFVRYPLPARDNIALKDLGAAADGAAIQRAVERAGAQPAVDAMPAGLDTPLSRSFTGGTDLSGGQWQRIALARALYGVETGAGVLVLDEPAANLDARGEAELYDRFLELTRGRTSVVISHRFSTVRRADQIVVMDEGRIVEQGTHQELLDLAGRYATLFRAQATRYADDDEPAEADRT